ncbi:hypothetical protein ACWGRJ_46395, partial [Bradyrhizobium sp. Lot11]
VVATPQSQDRTPLGAIGLATLFAAAAYRASGLVPWPIGEVVNYVTEVRLARHSGLDFFG